MENIKVILNLVFYYLIVHEYNSNDIIIKMVNIISQAQMKLI